MALFWYVLLFVVGRYSQCASTFAVYLSIGGGRVFVVVRVVRPIQLMMYQFLITSFIEVVYFLKLGPIFVASYPSERKSNHKNN